MTLKAKILVLSILITAPFHLFAEEACQKAKDIWKERNLYDIEAQTSRIAKRKELISAIQKVDAFGAEMVEVKKRIVAALPVDRAGLWNEYEAIDELRNKSSDEAEELNNEYSKMSDERRRKIADYKDKEISAKIICLNNKKLGERLGSVKKEGLLPLIRERAALIETANSEIKKKIKDIESLKKAFAEKPGAYDGLSEKQSELSDLISEYSDKIADISEKILKGL